MFKIAIFYGLFWDNSIQAYILYFPEIEHKKNSSTTFYAFKLALLYNLLREVLVCQKRCKNPGCHFLFLILQSDSPIEFTAIMI